MNNEKDNKMLIVTIFDNLCVSWEEMDGNLSVKDFKDMLVNKYHIPTKIVFEINQQVLPIRKNAMLKELDKRKNNCIQIYVYSQNCINKLILRE